MLDLYVDRFEKSADATIGKLTGVPSTYFTLEDTVREIPGQPVSSWKIAGVTAIPVGRYAVTFSQSQRFSQKHTMRQGRPIQFWTALLINVMGFSGIRIHVGNKAADTEGCLVVGEQYVPGSGTIARSRAAMDKVQLAIEKELGWERVPGAPECWPAGTVPVSVWHYVQTSSPGKVWVTVK